MYDIETGAPAKSFIAQYERLKNPSFQALMPGIRYQMWRSALSWSRPGKSGLVMKEQRAFFWSLCRTATWNDQIVVWMYPGSNRTWYAHARLDFMNNNYDHSNARMEIVSNVGDVLFQQAAAAPAGGETRWFWKIVIYFSFRVRLRTSPRSVSLRN